MYVIVKQINCKTYYDDYDDISCHLNKYDIFDFHFQVYCTTTRASQLVVCANTPYSYSSNPPSPTSFSNKLYR